MAQGYDYVIVGAGSAGCTLASRLSEDASATVCLIEAGKKDTSLLVRMPAGVGSLLKQAGPHNWGFWTEPQEHMNNRSLYWPRGKGWGGSSSINGMIYIRGHARDYDLWGQMGLRGWSYEDVLPYFKKSQSYSAGDGQFHGRSGPLSISNSPLNNPVYEAFIEAGQEAGYPVTDDFNGAQQEGMGPYQRNIHEGERWSASFAYLRPALERPNLTVISTGLATKVILEGNKAIGVEIVEGKRGEARVIHANQEVIVCAGAVQSPQLLQLSGIGDPDELNAHGIEVKVASSGVGKNLQDHLDVTVIHEMPVRESAYHSQKGFKKVGVGIKYLMSKTGPGADNFLQAGGFLKTRDGLEMPDIQLHYVNAIVMDHGNKEVKKDGFTVHGCQLRPESRGTIGLRSADPFDPPSIDPNYLASEADRIVMRDTIKISRDICGQNALTPWRGKELMPGVSVKSNEEIDAFIRQYGETIYHPVGTVAMGANETSPLDGDLKVRGVDGLRVVDASVMPTLVGGNTNAPTIMIAEKISDKIKEAARSTAPA